MGKILGRTDDVTRFNPNLLEREIPKEKTFRMKWIDFVCKLFFMMPFNNVYMDRRMRWFLDRNLRLHTYNKPYIRAEIYLRIAELLLRTKDRGAEFFSRRAIELIESLPHLYRYSYPIINRANEILEKCSKV